MRGNHLQHLIVRVVAVLPRISDGTMTQMDRFVGDVAYGVGKSALDRLTNDMATGKSTFLRLF